MLDILVPSHNFGVKRPADKWVKFSADFGGETRDRNQNILSRALSGATAPDIPLPLSHCRRPDRSLIVFPNGCNRSVPIRPIHAFHPRPRGEHPQERSNISSTSGDMPNTFQRRPPTKNSLTRLRRSSRMEGMRVRGFRSGRPKASSRSRNLLTLYSRKWDG